MTDPQVYISTMMSQLRHILRDVQDNASLYTREELEDIQVLAQELDKTITTNLAVDNYFDC